MSSSGDEPVLAIAAPVNAPVAPPIVPAAAAAVVAAPVDAPDVSTAAILHDTTADEDKLATPRAPAQPGASKSDTAALTALLEDKPAAPAHKPARSREEIRAAEHAREKRLALRERLEKKDTEKHPLARKMVAKKSATPEVDSDVALLAALVAHSKASQPKPQPVSRAPAADADAHKLRQCKALDSVAEADACRARLCAGSAKTSAACRPASGAQVVDAS
jgi:hypothetical protein